MVASFFVIGAVPAARAGKMPGDGDQGGFPGAVAGAREGAAAWTPPLGWAHTFEKRMS